jgi:phosphoribosyl 1,2-cyclic phosphodiesterase
MNEESSPGLAGKPIQNMRITLWGVQGSCPIFPTPYGVQEFSRRLAVQSLTRAFDEMQKLARQSADGRISIEEILGGPMTRSNIEEYQARIGLPELPVYGGDTTCIEVETSDGDILLFDAGSGIRRCSLEIVRKWADRKDRSLHIFGSHEHLDHRSGLTFSRFCYVENNPFKLHVYGSYQFLHALDEHYGLFSKEVSETTYVDDPVDYTTMPAKFTATEFHRADDATARQKRHWQVRDMAEPVRIGRTTVTPFEVYHVIPCCLAYKVEHNGATFVFCTDHELRRGADPNDLRQQRSMAAEARLVEHCRDVDVAYLDGQYFVDEYLGKKGIGSFPAISRLDWGHTCIEDTIDRAIRCNIKRTYIGHHDPERQWPERVDVDRQLSLLCRGKPYHIQLAEGDAVIDL